MFPKNILGASALVSDPNSTRNKAPKKPTAIPIALGVRIFSLIITADNTTTKIGDTVISTALLIGVESDKPLKKASILIHIPNAPHKTKRGQSFLSIRSFGPNNPRIQKREVATSSLTQIKPKYKTILLDA